MLWALGMVAPCSAPRCSPWTACWPTLPSRNAMLSVASVIACHNNAMLSTAPPGTP